MVIEIPSNYYPFQLNITVKAKDKVKLRIIAIDPNKPATKFVDRTGM